MKRKSFRQMQSGFSLIEVLVAMVITLIGLLGLAALQARAMTAEFESYQRTQALVLATDMVERIRMNRAFLGAFKNVSNSTNGTGFVGAAGSGKFSLDCASTDHAMQSLCDWDTVLRGAVESTGGGFVGAMVDARGCVTYDATTEVAGVADSGEFMVSVVWQGTAATEAPTIPGSGGAALHCADGLYKVPGGAASESYRRGVAFKFRLANLAG